MGHRMKLGVKRSNSNTLQLKPFSPCVSKPNTRLCRATGVTNDNMCKSDIFTPGRFMIRHQITTMASNTKFGNNTDEIEDRPLHLSSPQLSISHVHTHYSLWISPTVLHRYFNLPKTTTNSAPVHRIINVHNENERKKKFDHPFMRLD